MIQKMMSALSLGMAKVLEGPDEREQKTLGKLYRSGFGNALFKGALK